MVVLNKIYTKTGDSGTTALGTGERRFKYDLRVSAYGTVDESARRPCKLAVVRPRDDSARCAASGDPTTVRRAWCHVAIRTARSVSET